MENIVGSPVFGDNFFGRESELKQLRSDLNNHDILLLGPRRIGKTSISRRLMQQLEAEGWLVVKVEVGSCNNEREFLHKYLCEIKSCLDGPLKKWVDRVDVGIKQGLDRLGGVGGSLLGGLAEVEVKINPGNDPGDWIVGNEKIKSALINLDKKLFIYIDELPIFLQRLISNDLENGVSRAQRFLNWFRNDIHSDGTEKMTRHLLSGSIGLDTVAQRYGLSASLNLLLKCTLKPYDQHEACMMVNKLLAGKGVIVSSDFASKVVEAIGWTQPFYLQMVVYNLAFLLARHPEWQADEVRWIEAAIAEMLSSVKGCDFAHWDERLDMQLSPQDAQLARCLLTHSALKKEGAMANDLFKLFCEKLDQPGTDGAIRHFAGLRELLVGDGYWSRENDEAGARYRFCLEPLRRWWLLRNRL